MNRGKIEVTAINVEKGIIVCVGERGEIEYYAQRGIKGLSQSELLAAIRAGLLNSNALSLKTFPENYKLVAEDSSIQGRMAMSFNKKNIQKLTGHRQ